MVIARTDCSLTKSARSSYVRNVVVNGEQIVADERSTKVDEDKVVADAIQAAQAVIKKTHISELVTAWRSPKGFYTAK